ncbi:transmembrane protein 11 homolog, mitochondrial isoform X2 [Neocloeon triangulifer]|uniref:transmembrane protein 11 homolog, mitochondrial isoform X2 n=1 Tax=Neocloeon triangulifer TaxID=2078957 RepID=UPI00286F5EE2|nr:transmembrane protein 11 homolog, mitochondrial isoform X2 [Neocloeon triangulifer]
MLDLEVVREIYDSENSHEYFEQQLDLLLEAGVKYIVIEPKRLGDETARWLSVGNILHKLSLNLGLGAIIAGVLWPDRPVVCVPLASLSLLSTSLYTVSWHFDPCCQYQVEKDKNILFDINQRYPIYEWSRQNLLGPVKVLVRREALQRQRQFVHWTVCLAAVAFSGFRLYKALSGCC